MHKYKILGLMPEVPEGHEFFSEIENLHNNPQLWEQECPYNISDIRNVDVYFVEPTVVYTVFQISVDGGFLGEMWKYQPCSSLEKAEEVFKLWTQPIRWGDGRDELYVEDTVRGISGMVCWRPRLMVYISKKELAE